MVEYVICFTQRSGSSWLADMLTSAGLGPCREFLENESKVEDFSDCLGLKATQEAMIDLEGQLDIEDIKLIYLTRRDHVRQAISYYRALRTDQWSCFDPDKPNPPFDLKNILEKVSWVLQYEREWNAWLKDRPHLHLYYEDLGAESVEQIAAYLGRKVLVPPTSYFTIQRDEWTERCYQKLFEEVVTRICWS